MWGQAGSQAHLASLVEGSTLEVDPLVPAEDLRCLQPPESLSPNCSQMPNHRDQDTQMDRFKALRFGGNVLHSMKTTPLALRAISSHILVLPPRSSRPVFPQPRYREGRQEAWPRISMKSDSRQPASFAFSSVLMNTLQSTKYTVFSGGTLGTFFLSVIQYMNLEGFVFLQERKKA